MASFVGISPRQDLLDGHTRQVPLVANAAVFLQQIGQRGPIRQAAVTLTQGTVDLGPVQQRVVAYRTADDSRPAAGGRVMGVGPGQDQVDREAGSRFRTRLAPAPGCRELLGLPGLQPLGR